MTAEEKALNKKLREQDKLLKLVAKEAGKLREAFADQAGTLEKLKVESADHKKKLKMLIGDPLYAVPQELEKKVADLEGRVKKAFAQLTAKASQDDLDDFSRTMNVVDKRSEATDESVGDIADRLLALEEASTSPGNAKAPAPTKPDPRQTTLDEGIERSRAKADERAADVEGGPDHEDADEEDEEERAENAGGDPT